MLTPSIGRRQFVVNAGGALFCTLAGHRLSTNSHVDLEHLSSQVAVPPKVRAATAERSHTEYVTAQVSGGQTRTYWIKAVKTKRDSCHKCPAVAQAFHVNGFRFPFHILHYFPQ